MGSLEWETGDEVKECVKWVGRTERLDRSRVRKRAPMSSDGPFVIGGLVGQ